MERDDERLFLDAVTNAPVSIFALNREGVFLRSEGRGLEALGLKRGEVAGRSAFGIYKDKPAFLKDIRRALAGEAFSSVVELGGLFFEVRYEPVVDEGGVCTGTIGFAIDVSEGFRAQRALEESERLFRNLAEESPNTIFINARGRVVYANRMCEEIMGYDRNELYSEGFDFLSLIAPDSQDMVRTYLHRHMAGEELKPYECGLLTREGKRLDTIIGTKLIRYGGERAVLGIVTDITERKLMEERMLAMSMSDELTGLYNRRGFFALVEKQLHLAKRQMKRSYLLYADLDDLKAINDTHGHQEGDRALCDVARVLADTCRESDVVARIGGDEFVVIPIGTSEKDIRKVVGRFLASLAELNGQSDRPFTLSVSVGTACFDPKEPCSVDELLARADASMCEEKKSKERPPSHG
jgi:diguanylate cyclase (GGDEF)-like protein/PAS domain S-box-containing protein